jgi:imidazolonepropionase-like amidohydrolase
VPSTYIADVTLFDGRRVRAKHGVLIDGDRIGWVGPHARAPRTAKQADDHVDGTGRTLTPGLIDCHVHLCFDGSSDFAAEGRELDASLGAIKGTVNAQRHLAAGVTTVRDLGGLGITQLARAVERGLLAGPRIVAAGRALTVTGGHGHGIGFAREVDGVDALRQAVREEIRGGATAIKLVATGGVLTPGIGATFTAFTPEELAAAVDEAHSWGRGVAAHAIGAEGVTDAVRAGCDSIEHCVQVTPATAKEMKERGTFRSATLSALLGIAGHPEEVPSYAVEKASALLGDAEASQRRCVRAGVRHVCGTDAGTPFNLHGNAPAELVTMVEWGMKPLDAMVAATAHGAALLRVPDIGTVEEGKFADLVLYDANPVEDIRAVLAPRAVWRGVNGEG